MTLRGRSILVVSTEPWFGPLLSKHYVARELARHNRVLFVDPAYNMAELARRRWPRAYLRERYHDWQPENLRRLHPWRLPKDHEYRLVGKASQVFIAAQIRARGFRPDLIVSFNPAYTFLLDYWRVPFVYYSVDSQIDPVALAEALRRADLVITSSDTLYRRYQGRARRLEFLPHGVNVEALTRNANQTPGDMARRPRPVAGYMGALNQRLDFTLIEHLAGARPGFSIPLIGPYAAGEFGGGLSEAQEARLRRLPNVDLLGPKPLDELGAYINALDVAIVPYAASHPGVQFDYHKTLQILALGKPMVTTCQIPRHLAPPGVYMGQTPEAFVAAIDRALAEQDPAAAEACREFARQNTWARRGEQLAELLTMPAIYSSRL